MISLSKVLVVVVGLDVAIFRLHREGPSLSPPLNTTSSLEPTLSVGPDGQMAESSGTADMLLDPDTNGYPMSSVVRGGSQPSGQDVTTS
jgi:hypothetical protein